jgi:CheY-like chemotaxis protein
MGCVLVIDEYAPFRELMEFCLPRFGHAVMTAADVRAAVLLDGRSVDVVLLDVGTRWMTGFAACAELKRNEEFARVPVVIMAGNIGAEMQRRAREAGAAEIVVKPFNWPDLLDLLARHAAEAHLGEPA